MSYKHNLTKTARAEAGSGSFRALLSLLTWIIKKKIYHICENTHGRVYKSNSKIGAQTVFFELLHTHKHTLRLAYFEIEGGGEGLTRGG